MLQPKLSFLERENVSAEELSKSESVKKTLEEIIEKLPSLEKRNEILNEYKRKEK